MKTFAAAMAAFLIIIGGTTIYIYVLSGSVDTMEVCVENIMTHAREENGEDCQASLNEFLEHWDSAKKWVAAFIHHDEMDLINEALYEIKGYIEYQNAEQTIVKANVLQILLEHIPENEKFTIENIF